MSITPLLFQTGYLTVAEVCEAELPETYLLRMPNREVREAFYLNLVSEFSQRDEDFAESAYKRMKKALENGDIPMMMRQLKSLYESIPYDIHVDLEAYYHSLFYAVSNLLGFRTSAEVHTSRGRIDAVLELGDVVYILEFKHHTCAIDARAEQKAHLFKAALDDGIRQIKARGYYKKYEGSGKTVHNVAIALLGRADIDMRMETVVNTRLI